MRTRALLTASVVAVGLMFGALAAPSQAAKKLEGSVTALSVVPWLGLGYSETKAGSDTVTALAFADACQADREAHAAGNSKGATHVADFLESDMNGVDAFVFDLGKEGPLQGEYKAEGPGAVILVPDAAGTGLFVPTYDLDLDFFTGPQVDAKTWDQASDGLGCPNANQAFSSSEKCYSHKPDPHEKTNCVAGYKDAKKVKHGPRYVMVSGSLNLTGPMKITLTHP